MEENVQMVQLCGERRISSLQPYAMRVFHSPALCEFYEPGNTPTGSVKSHFNYPDYVIDPPRCSWDSLPKGNSVSTWDSPGTRSKSSAYGINFDSPQLSPGMPIQQEAYPLPTPPSSSSRSGRKCMPKKLPPDYLIDPPPYSWDSLLKLNSIPDYRINFDTLKLSPRMPFIHEAHPLPISPSSVPKKLPLPTPVNNPWKTQYPFQSSVSPQQCPKNWSKGEVLGKGSFGTVYQALNLDDGSFFAVKISDAETAAPEIRQEIDVLKRMNHPNIVRYLGSSVDDGHLCIFLELVGIGSLRRVLDKYKHFEETTIRTYTRQILWGLEYLHLQNTIHRDLKCANILVHPNGQVKLADFGVAKQMSVSLANSCEGTPLYMAPEMMKSSTENRKYGLAVDIWSLGCTIIEMAEGKAPWSDLQGFSFFFKMDRGELPPIPDHLSFEAKDFLCRCLKVKPEERATVSELLKHPFVTNAPAVVPPLSPHIRSQRL